MEPQQIIKKRRTLFEQSNLIEDRPKNYAAEPAPQALAATDPVVARLDKAQLEHLATSTKRSMEKAAKEMEFMEAARLRDEYFALLDLISSR